MFFLLLAFGFILLILRKAPKAPSLVDRLIDTRPKNCPPHKWSWVKLYNEDGTETGRERVVCALCGPLRASDEQ